MSKRTKPSDFLAQARDIAARCWCVQSTRMIEMDSRLAEAFAQVLAAWMADAARFARNADFFRDLVDECAKHLGQEAYTADDGTVMNDLVRLKVPRLVATSFQAMEEGIRAAVCSECDGQGMVSDNHDCGKCEGSGFSTDLEYTGADLLSCLPLHRR